MLELLGAKSAVGIDYMDVLKGVAGALQGTSGLMSGGGQSAAAQAAVLEQQRLLAEQQRQAAERAQNLKIGLGVAAGAFGLLIAGLVLRRPS